MYHKVQDPDIERFTLHFISFDAPVHLIKQYLRMSGAGASQGGAQHSQVVGGIEGVGGGGVEGREREKERGILVL